MPVLILRWASRPGYAAMFLALRREWPVTWRRYSLAKASSWGRGSVKTRIGASMPARRNSAPSWTVTTAREPAPASRAARETGTEPWPYALAFTTAMSRASAARRLRVQTLCRIAPRSTSAQVRLGPFVMPQPAKRFSEAGSYDVQGEDVHAGYQPDEPPVLDDGQYL